MTVGSNWVPALATTSRRATGAGYGFLYERAVVITANASATATILAETEIASARS